ncbi:MAG TPA: peptidylprolyl isomerase [Candidatus Caenarcaniphilales bacterium]
MTNLLAPSNGAGTSSNNPELFQVGDQVVHAQEILPLLERYQLLPQLIQEIILDQAIREFSCSEAEHQAALHQFFQQLQLTDPEQQKIWLNSQNLTLEQLEQRLLRPILLEKFKVATWTSKIESYFLTRKASLDQVVYSLIRTKDQGTIQELYFRIKEGERSFSDLAREYSQGPEAYTAGLVGPTPLSKPHPVIARLLSTSQPGQLRTPTRLEDWFVIIRLEKFFPAQLDESMRRRLLNELFENWLQEQVQQVGLFRS